MKKTYVVRCESGEYWCGLRKWDNQLRKAQIFTSLEFAGRVVFDYKHLNPTIVEVRLEIVSDTPTNADVIRATSDEELAALLYDDVAVDDKLHFCQMRQECMDAIALDDFISDEKCMGCLLEWLRKPADHFREVRKMVGERP